MNTAERAREQGIKVGDEVEVSFRGKVTDVSRDYVEVVSGETRQTTGVSDIRLIRRAPVTCPDHKQYERCRWGLAVCGCAPCNDTHRELSPPVPPTSEELAEALRETLRLSNMCRMLGTGDANKMLARWDAAKGAK